MTSALILALATLTVADPMVREDLLDPSRHSALASDLDFLQRRYGREAIRVQAVSDGRGGAFLLVGPDRRSRLYRVGPGNRVVWHRDDALIDLDGTPLLLPGFRPGEFAVVSRPGVYPKSDVRLLRFDLHGRPLGTLALPYLSEPSVGAATVAAWPGRGWIVAYQARLPGADRRPACALRAHLLAPGGGDGAWPAQGTTVGDDLRCRGFELIRDAKGRFLFVWSAEHDNQPEYKAQALDARAATLWPKPVSLGEGATYSLAVTIPPRLTLTSDGIHVALIKGSLSDMHSKFERYAVRILPGGAVQPDPAAEPPPVGPAWAGSLPVFGALPLRTRWAALVSRRRVAEPAPCPVVPRGGRFSTQPAPGECESALRVSLPASSRQPIQVVAGPSRLRISDPHALGAARPELPRVGYATDFGAVYWAFDAEGVHAWSLFTNDAASTVRRFEVLGGLQLRERDGAVEVLARGEPVLTVVVSGVMRGASLPGDIDDAGRISLRARGRFIELEVGRPAGSGDVAVRLSWAPGSTMAVPRRGHVAVPMTGGRFAIMGGESALHGPTGPLPVEVFDPIARRWTAGPPLPGPVTPTRYVRVADRHVVLAWEWPVAMGQRRAFEGPARPTRLLLLEWGAEGAFRRQIELPVRDLVDVAPLDEHTLAIVSGPSASSIDVVNLLDGTRHRVEDTPPSVRGVHPLGPDRLAVFEHRASGVNDDRLRIYDWRKERWESIPEPAFGCQEGLTLDNGKIVLWCSLGPFLLDPVAGTWRSAGPQPRAEALFPLTSGRVLVIHGPGAKRPVQLWQPETDSWSPSGAAPPLEGAALLEAPDGKVWLVGGGLHTRRVSPWVFEPERRVWARP